LGTNFGGCVLFYAFTIFGVESPGMAAVPIIVIVTITAVKDAVEDYRRTLLDLELNNTPTQVLAYCHNFNVTDEDISLWRRIKKASTKLTVKTFRALKPKKKHLKEQLPIDNDPFDIELTRAMTVNSIYSHNYSHDNDNNIDEDIQNPFDSSTPSTNSVGSVLDYISQSPGKAKFKRDFWKNVRVGDFVRIRNNDEIPADIVILATSDEDGACYVETKNLDGETNLKVRQALKCGEGIKHALDCERTKFWIESEGPHPNLYAYNGVAKWYQDATGDKKHDDEYNASSEPITINNMLLRGCSLRNTEWAIGIAVFTGTETKIMLNAGITPTKRSLISRQLNFSVLTNFGLLFVLCFASGLVNGIVFAESNTSIDYFEYGMIGGTPPLNGLVTFWAALVLYQSLVPISLYISIEIVKTIQAFFIYSDYYMSMCFLTRLGLLLRM
jgi:phospholipid-translocating ATPase